ncbi:MAG: sulfatase [Planctomycetota bacterium]
MPPRRRSARPLAALPLFLAALLGGCGDGELQPARRVILITCDTLRADRMGVYGCPQPTTPALDAFAREAIVFDRAYSTAPLTLPSVCSMLTGRLPAAIGVEHNRQFLPSEVQTIAERLSGAGIATAAVVSNWVLVNPPGMPPEFGVRQGFAHYDATMTSREAVRGMPERVAPATTAAAIRWLERALDAGEDRFFLWVHYQDPHGPYVAPESFVREVDRPLGDEAPVPFAPGEEGKGGIPVYQRLGDERHPEYYRIRYDAEIRYLDAAVGRLLDFLRARGLLADALVVFSADHGESLGEHDYWFCHGESLSGELLRVPLLVRYPAGMPHPRAREAEGHRRVDEVVNQLDLFPTVLAAFGLAPGSGPGTSLLARSLPAGRVAVQMLGLDDGSPRRRAVNDGRWRLHLGEGQAPRLYDLAADPGEERDLAAEHPDVVAAMKERYAAFLARDAGESLPGQTRALSAEEERILRGLGYAGKGGGGD